MDYRLLSTKSFLSPQSSSLQTFIPFSIIPSLHPFCHSLSTLLFSLFPNSPSLPGLLFCLFCLSFCFLAVLSSSLSCPSLHIFISTSLLPTSIHIPVCLSFYLLYLLACLPICYSGVKMFKPTQRGSVWETELYLPDLVRRVYGDRKRFLHVR